MFLLLGSMLKLVRDDATPLDDFVYCFFRCLIDYLQCCDASSIYSLSPRAREYGEFSFCSILYAMSAIFHVFLFVISSMRSVHCMLLDAS